MKKSMTYLEVTLALIIISITISISYPKYDDDRLEIAADELIVQMKYISYLATLQDNFDVKDINHKGKLWQIRFHKKIDKKDVVAYSIFKDKNGDGRYAKNEFLFDKFVGKSISPLESKYRYYKERANKSTFLNKMYGIDDIKISDKCTKNNSRKLMFDKYGQIHIRYDQPKLSKKLSATMISKPHYPNEERCIITLVQGDKKLDICIEAKTSYIYKCDNAKRGNETKL